MDGRRKLRILFLVVIGIASGIVVGAIPMARNNPDPVVAQTVMAVALLGVVGFVLWRSVEHIVLRRLAALVGEIRGLSHASGTTRIPRDRYGDLAPLADAVNELADTLASARADTQGAVARSTAEVEEQRGRLGALLRDLHEGVVVCNLSHQVLLYNKAALALLGDGNVGLGRDLLRMVSRPPILHTLERLIVRVRDGRHLGHADGATAQFVAATNDGQTLLQGRMSLIFQEHGSPAEDPEPASDGDGITGYVVTFVDVTADLATLGKRDALLRSATEDLRPPIATLRAAIETIADTPDLDPADRAAFEGIILDESQALSERIERITSDYRNVITSYWPTSDIYSGNLIDLVTERARHAGHRVIQVGLSQWLHGDSYSLVTLLDHLIERVAETTGARSFDLSAETDGRWVFIDLLWTGVPIGAARIEAWMREPLAGALGGLTAGDVLQHHRSDLWSEPRPDGAARLRLPLPPAKRRYGAGPRAPLPTRPEFFDFGLLHQPLATSELGRMALRALTYVVFDTETTGLRPSDGDEMIAIAGVRIVNGRILTGETFTALIDPGRRIPEASIRFHGITDAMVRGRPPAEAVLPDFHAFAAGAVLVAHNAAFDLKFLRLKERAAGVRFDNPVLDTMMLARHLLGNEADVSLDGIAATLGLEVVDRHTALGDALVTAAMFLRFVNMMDKRGIRTLDDAIRVTNMLVELAARERAF